MDVFIESQYPRELVDGFGADTKFVAYLTESRDDMPLGGASTHIELITELRRWIENKAVYPLIKDDIDKYAQIVKCQEESEKSLIRHAVQR